MAMPDPKMWYLRNKQPAHLTEAEALEGQFCPRCGRDCIDYTTAEYDQLVAYGECANCYAYHADPITQRAQAKHAHLTRLVDMLRQRQQLTAERVAEITTNLYGADRKDTAPAVRPPHSRKPKKARRHKRAYSLYGDS